MSTGDFPESLSQAMLVGIIVVGRLGVYGWKNRGVRSRRIRDFKQHSFNGIPPTSFNIIRQKYISPTVFRQPLSTVFRQPLSILFRQPLSILYKYY